MYRGFVVSNDDPMALQRLKVRVPALFGAEPMAAWAWPCLRMAAAQVGEVIVPPVDAGVWVDFETGMDGRPDYNKPIWLGCWAGAPGGMIDTPEEAQDGYPNVTAYRSEKGFLFIVDEQEAKEQVRIEDTVLGLRLVLDRVAQTLAMEAPEAGLRATVNLAEQAVELGAGEVVATLEKQADRARVANSAVELLADAGDVLLRAIGGAAHRLVDERFLSIYNGHKHSFVDSNGDSGITATPDSPGSVGAHTTDTTKGG